MKETELLFEAHTVRTILEGRKTQARAIIEPQPLINKAGKPYWRTRHNTPQLVSVNACPFGRMGDRLWVREAYTASGLDGMETYYRATSLGEDISLDLGGEKKAHESLNFTLDVIGVQVDRLHNISHAECLAEGYPNTEVSDEREKTAALDWYRLLWDAENGYGAWAENPWVWVLSFYPTSMWVKGKISR